MKAWPFVAMLILAYFYRVGWWAIVARNNAIATAQAAPAVVQPENARERWAADLASRLGNTTPSADTIAFLVEWTMAEDSSDGAMARNNPLNTTQSSGAATMIINGDGVKGYASYQDGLDATVTTLANGYYNEIVAGIQTNDPERALSGLIASPWAISHYNGGRDWPQYTLEAPLALTGEAETRASLVAYALALQGMPYISGGRSASGGDCSGTMQYIYKTIVGVDIGSTTFDQLPRLTPIDSSQVQPGDLWYGQFPDDQHTGMLADVNGDGQWDLIHNGADQSQMHVTYSFLTDSYLGQHTIGFRRALP